MKLFRFMSADECFKLIKGETLENNTDHSLKRGTASTAKGFCFGIGDEEQAKKTSVGSTELLIWEPLWCLL